MGAEQAGGGPEYVEVTGTGVVSPAPDRARIELAVEVHGDDVAAALDGCAATTGALVDALVAAGLERSALTTRALTVQPRWHHERPEVIGQTAGQRLRVRVAPDRVGEVVSLAAATCGDALRVDGLGWAHADEEPLRRRARELAMERARDAAEQLAALGGRGLGAVLRISEGHASAGLGGGARAAFALAERDLGVEPGELDVVESVVVRWALV